MGYVGETGRSKKAGALLQDTKRIATAYFGIPNSGAIIAKEDRDCGL